jgi:hypothetical protein
VETERETVAQGEKRELWRKQLEREREKAEGGKMKEKEKRRKDQGG